MAPNRRPFLVPSSAHASSPALPDSNFSTPVSLSSAQVPAKPPVPSQPQLSLVAKPTPSQKIPRVVADKISDLETRVAQFKDELSEIRDSVNIMTRSYEKAIEENEELTKLRGEVEELKEESEARGKVLESIQRILESLKANGGSLDKAMVKIETCSLSLQTGARKTFLRFMGITDSKQIKNVAPLGDDDYYLADPETGKNLLRPKWRYNYSQNSAWHADAIDFLRKKGPGFHPALTKAIIKSGQDPETKAALKI
jgi:seryl-tRNA synthetase